MQWMFVWMYARSKYKKNGTNKNQILWLQIQAVVHSTRKMYHDAVKTITF